jgi:hypothetical protein
MFTNMRTFLLSRGIQKFVWKIGVYENSIVIHSGLLGGIMNRTSEEYKLKGKDPEIYAIVRADQLIRHKIEEGYREI